MDNKPFQDLRRLAILFGMLAALLMIVLVIMLLDEPESASAPSSTIRPLFDDPRLSVTIGYNPATRVVPAPGTTETPYPLAETIDAIFEETRGVQNCLVAADRERYGQIVAECRVERGYNVVEMAELLRLLGDHWYDPDRYWWSNGPPVPVDMVLVLDDGQHRTLYEWDHTTSAWTLTPIRTEN
jgi:hypothetical protein